MKKRMCKFVAASTTSHNKEDIICPPHLRPPPALFPPACTVNSLYTDEAPSWCTMRCLPATVACPLSDTNLKSAYLGGTHARRASGEPRSNPTLHLSSEDGLSINDQAYLLNPNSLRLPLLIDNYIELHIPLDADLSSSYTSL